MRPQIPMERDIRCYSRARLSAPAVYLAKAWGKDIGEEVETRSGRPVGRPKGSSMYLTSESVQAWLAPYIKALWDEGKHPTQEQVATLADVDLTTMKYHVRKFFTWVKLLETLKDSSSN